MLPRLELAPQAVSVESQLLGFLAVAAAYGGLGFHVGAFFGGYVVGFESRSSLYSCLAASTILVALFSACRVFGVDAFWLRPFVAGAMVLGNVAYFLALLILSFDAGPVPKIANVVSLALALAVGSVFHIRAMTNAASTFGVLFAMSLQAHVKWGGATVVVVFANFVALYAAAHFLSTHPGYVAAIFDGSLYVAAPE